MFLKSIELHGFKSFPGKTVVKFEKGISVIIGPNGSGKSNISDAVRWVFGELSPKILRGVKMEDVIFSGAGDIKPSNFAGVALTLDNNDSEVKIERRLARSGESGYFLNGKTVRLKDIYELLLNTGMGKDGYSIIGQGRISELITKRGDELRAIIEEAAGTSKFRYKKDEAERKLTSVGEDLTRVNDIKTEIAARLGPLKIEAERAREYLKLKDEKDYLDVVIYKTKVDEIKPQLEEIIAQYNTVKTQYDGICRDVAKIDRDIETYYTEMQKSDFIIEQDKNNSIMLNNSILKKKTENEVLREKIRMFEDELIERSEQYEKNRLAIEALNNDIEQKKADCGKIKDECIEIEKQISELEAEQKKSESLNAAISELNKAKTGITAGITELNQAYEVNLKHIDTLKDIIENLDGYSDGVKNIMREQRRSDMGIYGLVSQLITIDGKYATAIETALGGNMQNVVIENETAAKEAIAFLKRTNGGRATFYPLTSVKATDPPLSLDEAENFPGYIAVAAELVDTDDKFREIMNYLLNRTIICDTLDNAVPLAQNLDYRYKIVTLDGQIINAGGSFTGGAVRRKSAVLSGRSEIAQINEKNKEILTLRDELISKAESVDTEIRKLLDELGEAGENEKINEAKLMLKEYTGLYNIEVERAGNLQTKRSDLMKENERIKARSALITQDSHNFKAQISRNNTDITATEERIAAIESDNVKRKLNKEQTEKKYNDAKNLFKEKNSLKDTLFRETVNIENQKVNLEKNHDIIMTRLWDEYELTYTTMCEYLENSKDKEELYMTEHIGKRLTVLKEHLKKYAGVNVGAIEEYAEVHERHTFLTEQSVDIENSINELRKIIEDLKSQIKVILKETIGTLNVAFNTVFTELFGGGYAEISTSDFDNILESDFEINVKLPGKQVKHLTLLSGGEQAFVAIALYFALLNINPSPFCILDEIEAALDEVNITRFASYLKKYSANTQFIVITHRRGTMEAADILYGVTMQNRGVSKIFMLDVKEVERNMSLARS